MEPGTRLRGGRQHLFGNVFATEIDWLIPVGLIALITALLWLSIYPVGPPPPFGIYILLFLPEFVIVGGIYSILRLRSDRQSIVERFPAALIGGVLMLTVLSFFTSLKIAIPSLNPFWFDPQLAGLERGVLGADAWRISHRLLGWATPAIDVFYVLWWPIQSITLAVVLFSQPSERKTRALIAYALMWLVLGVGVAMALSSVGPIFYDRLTGQTRFAGLEGHTIAATAASILWVGHTHHLGMVGLGISAMPSLHIAVAAWTAFVVRPKWIGLLYVLAMWISSVHLGWHYVSDGLVGIAGASLLWKLAGFMRVTMPERLHAATA